MGGTLLRMLGHIDRARAVMLYDWFKVDTTYTEDVLTSSREGELEAVSEKHRI